MLTISGIIWKYWHWNVYHITRLRMRLHMHPCLCARWIKNTEPLIKNGYMVLLKAKNSTGYLKVCRPWQKREKAALGKTNRKQYILYIVIHILLQESHLLFCWHKGEERPEPSKIAWVTCCSHENRPAHPASRLYLNPSDFYTGAKDPLLYKEWKIRILSPSRDSFFYDNWQLNAQCVISHKGYIYLSQICVVFPNFTGC